MEYLIISVPNERGNNVFDKVHQYLSVKHHLGEVLKFTVPELKVGTFDNLVELSDKLCKLDNFTDVLTRKLVHFMNEIMEEEKNKLQTYLTINQEPFEKSVRKFHWDHSEFSSKEPIEKSYLSINDKVNEIDIEFKVKSKLYTKIKLDIESIERKNNGSLLTRNLADLVKKEHFVLDSENLTTLLVVVAKVHYHSWRSTYNKLSEFVVPGSSELIFEDHEHGLFTVTLFKRIANIFTAIAKEKKFFVRDFQFDETKIDGQRLVLLNLKSEKKKEFINTFRWLTTKFKISIGYLLHVKSMRIFVESVLRYGLPVNFQPILVAPLKNQEKKVHLKLRKLFRHLDNFTSQFDRMDNSADSEDDYVANLLGEPEYFPYVCCKVELNYFK